MEKQLKTTGLNLKSLPDLLWEFWQRSSDACPLEASQQEEQEEMFQCFVEEKISEMTFDDSAEFLIKHLAEKHYPHMLVIVESDRAQLLEGIKSIKNDQFIVD